MIQRRPVLTFYLICFALLIVGTGLAFLVFNGNLWAQWIAVFTPTLAALWVTALVDGKQGVTELLARMLRFKVRWKWYLGIFGLPILYDLGWVFLSPIVMALDPSNSLVNAQSWLHAFSRGAPGLLLMTPLMAVLIMGEEIGWRGFALERLLNRYNPWVSSLIVGFFWGIWHVPSALDPTAVLNKAPLWISIPLFTLGTIVFSFVYTWLWQKTNGSLVIICLFHAFYDLLNFFTANLYPNFYIEFWLYLIGLCIIMLPLWLFPKHFIPKKLTSENIPV